MYFWGLRFIISSCFIAWGITGKVHASKGLEPECVHIFEGGICYGYF